MDNIITKQLEGWLYRVAQEIANIAQNEAPTRTRNLRNDIKVYKKGELTFSISNSRIAAYAPYVHFGTGIYGPKKRKIVPKNAKALKIPIDGKIIYRKSVKGQKPNPYMSHAVDIYLQEGIQRAISSLDSNIADIIGRQIRQELKSIKITVKV